MSKRFTTVVETAKVLGVSGSTVRNRLRDGTIPGMQLGQGRFLVSLPWLKKVSSMAEPGEPAGSRPQAA